MGNYLPAVIYDNNKDKDDTETESPKMCVTDFCEHFQDLLESAEHQTCSALMVVDTINTGTKTSPKRHNAAGAKPTKISETGTFIQNKKILKEQLQALQKTHNAMTSLVHKAMNSNKTPGEETQTNEYARDIQFYQRTVEDLKEEVFALKEENSSLEEENRSLKLQFEPTATPGQSNKTNETGSVDPDLESMECQSSVTDVVQVFPAKIKGRDRVEEFTSLVYTNCESSGYGLNIQVLDKPEDIRSDQPVLMLCMKVSRLRTDVESALKGLKLNEHVGLVILHQKEIHAPDIEPSEKLLSAEFKKKGPKKIFDMAYVSTKGIYECDMNQTAIDNIVSFIKSLNSKIQCH